MDALARVGRLSLQPRPMMTPAIDRALEVPAVVRDGMRPSVAPAVQTAGSREDAQRPVVQQFYFQPKGVLDRGSVREIWEKELVPMAEGSIRTGRLGAAAQKRVLE
jgi:hypothetical protein